MPNKRSRAGNSSTLFASHASLPLLESNHIPSPAPAPSPLIKQPYNPKKVVKHSSSDAAAAHGATIDESRRLLGGVLSLSPAPVQDDGATATGRSGHLLEPAAASAGGGGLSQRCFTCSKKFDQTMDLFMYRGLAFCNGVCRDEPIEIDSAQEKKI